MRYEDARVFMMEQNLQLNKFWRKRIREFQEAMATIYDLDLMRQAIEAIEPINEFVDNELGWCDICQWCHNIIASHDGSKSNDGVVEGHAPDCLRQRALGLDKQT